MKRPSSSRSCIRLILPSTRHRWSELSDASSVLVTMGRSRLRIEQWASVACGLVVIAVFVVAVAGNLLAVDLGSGYLKVWCGLCSRCLCAWWDSFQVLVAVCPSTIASLLQGWTWLLDRDDVT